MNAWVRKMKEEKAKTVLTVAQLASSLDARLVGDGSAEVTGVSGLEIAGASEVAFLSESRHVKALKTSNAAAVIVAKEIESPRCAQLIVGNIDAGLIKALEIFAPKLTPQKPGVHPAATVEKDAEIGAGASIGPGAYVGHKAVIGKNSVIKAGCKVGENSIVGSHCRIDENVVIYHNYQGISLSKIIRSYSSCDRKCFIRVS